MEIMGPLRKICTVTAGTSMMCAALLIPAGPAGADTPPNDPVSPEENNDHASAYVKAGVSFKAKDEDVIVDLTNKARIEHCRPVLLRNKDVDKVARNWSKKMAETGYFEHNPNYGSQMPQANYRGAGENIASGPSSGKGMFELWKNSPGHWQNLLNPAFTDIGVGFATGANVPIWDDDGDYGGKSQNWATQNFGIYTHHQGGEFLDVRKGYKFYNEINWLFDKKLATGYDVPKCDKKTFKPLTQVSREAMAAFLYRYAKDVARDPSAVGYKPPAQVGFPDVPTGHKFYEAISWLVSQKITTGYTDGTFRPRGKISREAMAAFMYRYAGKPPAKNAPKFKDVSASHDFYDAITWMASVKITEGYNVSGGKEFRPRNKTSREATAAFLQRFNAVK